MKPQISTIKRRKRGGSEKTSAILLNLSSRLISVYLWFLQLGLILVRFVQ